MERIGVMLAAGEASRLPYKPLLPLRDGHSIAIESGLELLHKSCARVIVVHCKDSLIPTVLHKRRWRSLDYCVQQGEGVVAAIASARQHMLLSMRVQLSAVLTYVTFCDNVFTDEETLPPEPCASVRRNDSIELDRYDFTTKRWVSRVERDSPWALAGWYALKGDSLPTHHSNVKSGIDLLNSLEVDALCVDRPWYDIGTIDTYARYMQCST